MQLTDKSYWTQRYINKTDQWDIGSVSTPLKSYFDQLIDKNIKILIPGGGFGHEAHYLWSKGFSHVYILDFSHVPLEAFSKKWPDFPRNQILHEDFFEHKDQYDLIVEQTFFCALSPDPIQRKDYAQQMNNLLSAEGKLVGLFFDIPTHANGLNPPFGGTKKEYIELLKPYFSIKTFESAYNSITPRQGKELFAILTKN